MSRTARYTGVFPVQRLVDTPVVIVGTGSIGRQVAVCLSTMGAQHMTIVDPDTVSDVNLGPQGWAPADIGRPKVQALMDELVRVNPDCQIVAVHSKYTPRIRLCGAVFATVDSMSVRSAIFARAEKSTAVEFFADARMSAESFRAFACTRFNRGFALYSSTLYPDEGAYQGPCTARSTYYCAATAAGFLVASYTQHLRGLSPEFEVSMSFKDMTLEIQNG